MMLWELLINYSFEHLDIIIRLFLYSIRFVFNIYNNHFTLYFINNPHVLALAPTQHM